MNKKWLYLYEKGPCDQCACTICEVECDRNISPCDRCEEERKPLLACITFGEKKLGRVRILRGIVPDDWEVKQ